MAPRVAADAVAEPITRRNWTDEWVTVRCGACGREDDWPRPELGCQCGAVLRVPVRAADAAGPGGGTDRPDVTDGATEQGAGDPGGPSGPGAPGAGPCPGAVPPRTTAPDASRSGADPEGGSGVGASAPDVSRTGGPSGPDVSRTGGPRADGPRAGDGPGRGVDGAGAHGPDTDTGPDTASPHGPEGPAPREPYRPFTERYPAHIPLPPTGPRPAPARGAFRPVTIRTGRDAVAAAAGYLRWLGFRDVVQPEERPASGVDLRAPGLVAQVDPSTRPTGLRAVECLWLNGLSTSAVSVFFALAGYTPEARSRAAEIGLPLFVLDLTGTPQPVNRAADDLVADGA
ncbi:MULTISPECIES: hypothetical protein [unclassified Streptomyces]|uniref:hypothetical protein n=1 Tax=unclassified Streptomyces TaxID=2593676 RepID=UPI0006AF40ED|nr:MULTISPECIES: hypothetical protein [unclassified Streptomyces]